MTKKGNKLTPLHYQIDQSNYDVIDFIKDYNLNFNKGNIVKYIARSGRKDCELKDLDNAADYLDREIKYTRERQKEWIENNKL
jgi:hypothetical protein